MLTADERASFADKGWLVVRGVIDADRIQQLKTALDTIIPEARYASGYRGRVVEIASISRGSSEIEKNTRDPRLTRLAAAALGVDRLRLFQDTAFIKPASGGGGVEWHQDFSYFAFFERPCALTLRLALTPCTIKSGCLRVISGSHSWGLQSGDLSFRAARVDDALGGLSPELRARAASNEATIELAPGDVSLHHCLTFHSSQENQDTSPRKTLAIRYMEADLRVVIERLPSKEALARLAPDAEGRLGGEMFPLVL